MTKLRSVDIIHGPEHLGLGCLPLSPFPGRQVAAVCGAAIAAMIDREIDHEHMERMTARRVGLVEWEPGIRGAHFRFHARATWGDLEIEGSAWIHNTSQSTADVMDLKVSVPFDPTCPALGLPRPTHKVGTSTVQSVPLGAIRRELATAFAQQYPAAMEWLGAASKPVAPIVKVTASVREVAERYWALRQGGATNPTAQIARERSMADRTIRKMLGRAGAAGILEREPGAKPGTAAYQPGPNFYERAAA